MHLKPEMEFTRKNVGEHNIPRFLHNNWNDSIHKISKEKNKAESAFVFFQAAHAAYELIQLFKYLNDTEKGLPGRKTITVGVRRPRLYYGTANGFCAALPITAKNTALIPMSLIKYS